MGAARELGSALMDPGRKPSRSGCAWSRRPGPSGRACTRSPVARMPAVVTVIRRAARFPLVARLSPHSVPFHHTTKWNVPKTSLIRQETGKSGVSRSAHGWPASGLRTSWFAWCYEGSPAVDGDDDSALAQQRHCVPHRGVRDPVFLGEAPLAGEFPRDLALGDPPLDVVRYLNVGIFSSKGINRTRGHKINIGCSLSCKKTD